MNKIVLFTIAMTNMIKMAFTQIKPEIVVQTGHKGRVLSVRFSPDEKFVLSGSADNSVRIWEIASGKEVKVFDDNNQRSMAVFSADGKSIIMESNKIYFRDYLTGKIIKTLDGHAGYTSAISVSKDGKYIVSGGYDKTIKIWDLATGQMVRQINGHDDRITSVQLSKDETQIISTSADGTIKFWDFTNGQLIRKISGQNYEVSSSCLSHDGKLLATGVNVEVKIWDALNGENKTIINKNYSLVTCMVFTNDDKSLLVGYSDNSIILYDIATGEKIRTFKGHSAFVNDVCLSKDGKTFLSAGDDNVVKLWNVETGEELKTFKGKLNWIECFALSKNNELCATGSKDNTIKLWNIKEGKLIQTFTGHKDFVNAVCFSPNQKYLFSASYDHTAKMWDLSTGKEIKTFSGHNFWVSSVAISPDGKTIATGGGYDYDKNIKIWDVETGREKRNITGHTRYINCLDFSPDGSNIISCSPDRTIRIWDINTGTELRKLEGCKGNIVSAVYSKDGNTILSAADDSTLRLWDSKTGNLIRTIKGKEMYVWASFSPDETKIVSGSNNSSIRVWDIRSGLEIQELVGHTDWVSCVRYTNDGKSIVSCSNDNSIKIWDVASGKWIYSALANPDGSQWLVYNQEGYWDSSTSGGELVAMVKDMNVWSIDQFAARNNRPDKIIEKIPDVYQSLVKHYQNQYLKRLKKLGLTEDKVASDYTIPVAKITGSQVNGKNVVLNISLSDSKYLLKKYNLYVNDVPLFGVGGKEITGNKKDLIETVELVPGRNKIEVSCLNSKGSESYRAMIYEEYKEKSVGSLYFLAFGVSKYQNPAYNLAYADKDAVDLSKVIEAYKSKGFENVYTKVLTNEQVTPDAIKSAKDFVKNAKPDDTFVLFIAGHGMHDKDAEATYYYLTSNADINNLKGTAADFETIEDLLQGIPPRNKLFLMDACESGEIDDETYENLSGFQNLKGLGIASRGFKSTSPVIASGAKQSQSTKRSYLYQKDRYIYNDLVRRSGAIVFSSSKGGELSYERSDIENGLFTEYIMKALTTTEADKDGNGIVSTDELRQYVSEQVAKASGDLQHPTVDRDNIYQKFGFGVK